MRCARLPAVRRAGAPAAPRGADSARGVPESACGRSAAWPSLGWPAYRSVGQSSGSTWLRKRREVVGTGPDRVAGIRGSDQAPVAARSAEQRRGAPRPVVVARRAVRRYARQARQAVVPCRIRSAAVCSGYRAGRPAAARATKWSSAAVILRPVFPRRNPRLGRASRPPADARQGLAAVVVERRRPEALGADTPIRRRSRAASPAPARLVTAGRPSRVGNREQSFHRVVRRPRQPNPAGIGQRVERIRLPAGMLACTRTFLCLTASGNRPLDSRR